MIIDNLLFLFKIIALFTLSTIPDFNKFYSYVIVTFFVLRRRSLCGGTSDEPSWGPCRRSRRCLRGVRSRACCRLLRQLWQPTFLSGRLFPRGEECRRRFGYHRLMVQALLREAIHLRNENPVDIIPKGNWLTRLENLLKENLDNLLKEFNELKRGILKCRDYIFNFLENPAIPSDNNGSERGIRKLKIKLKISGCFRSESGADAFHALHSIADTAWKNGQSPLGALLELV